MGRDAAGEDLSTFAGDGDLLHGAVRLPSRLALGGDIRGAFVSNDVQDPSGTATAFFPMQADLSARVSIGAGVSVSATGGLRGQARSSDTPVPMQNFQSISTSRLISREHYVMWQPEVLGPYARAGRFFAPFGLRMAEHILYVRRDLGFNLLQESYNLSGGYVAPAWEVHATAFAPDFVRHIGGTESGFAAYGERRLRADTIVVGAQTRLAFGNGGNRFIVGGVGKLYLERLRTLLLAEANLVRLGLDDQAVPARGQLVGAAGFTVLPTRGVMVTLLAERNQLDLKVRDAGWTAGTGIVNWFPYPHVDLQLVGRLQAPGGGVLAKTLLAQIHYFL
jgi:hypothetical protein